MVTVTIWPTHLWVMNESSTLAVGWEIAGGGILETLDDGLNPSSANRPLVYVPLDSYRLPRSVVSDNQCKRCMKLDRLAAGVVE